MYIFLIVLTLRYTCYLHKYIYLPNINLLHLTETILLHIKHVIFLCKAFKMVVILITHCLYNTYKPLHCKGYIQNYMQVFVSIISSAFAIVKITIENVIVFPIFGYIFYNCKTVPVSLAWVVSVFVAKEDHLPHKIHMI